VQPLFPGSDGDQDTVCTSIKASCVVIATKQAVVLDMQPAARTIRQQTRTSDAGSCHAQVGTCTPKLYVTQGRMCAQSLKGEHHDAG